MRFIYVGEYPEGASSVVVYGHVFSPGVSVDLPEPLAAKARNNRFFFIAGDNVAPVAPIPEPNTQAPEPHELTKAELIDMAELAGVKFDGRWSADKIKQAINDAASALQQGQ